MNNNYLFLREGNATVAVPIENIVRIQARSNYSQLFLCNGKTLVTAKVLRWFEQQLPEHFVRIHRSHLVHKNQALFFSRKLTLSLHNGKEIEVSRRRKKDLKTWLR